MSDHNNDNEPNPLSIRREADVLHVALDRPQRANALEGAMVDALFDLFVRDETFAGIRALVITGNGKNFCGGFGLSDIASLSEGDIVLRFLRVEAVLQRLYHAPFITVACAQGKAVGAGADIFAACEHRVAAPGAGFRMPGWQFGIALGTRRLCDRVGSQIAREMLATGRALDADAALRCSLATQVARAESWPALLEKILDESTAISPAARSRLHALTAPDHREADVAALVASALGPPGIKARLSAYIVSTQQSKAPGR